MKDLFTKLLWAAPAVALLLYFALQGREEIKTEQVADTAKQELEAAKFDRDFADAWNNKPLKGPSDADIKAKEQQLADAKKAASEAAAASSADLKDMRSAINDATKSEVGAAQIDAALKRGQK